MQDFLNPKSMMTPAAAAATMMFIVNGLGAAFPELSLRLAALVVSFLIGSIVFASKSPAVSALWAKGVYWVLNSLIIFAFGFASNNYMAEANAQPKAQAVSQAERARMSDWLVPAAYADEQAPAAKSSKQPSRAAPKMRKEDEEAQLKAEQQKNEELTQKVQALEAAQAKQKETAKSSSQTGAEKPQAQQQPFFRKW